MIMKNRTAQVHENQKSIWWGRRNCRAQYDMFYGEGKWAMLCYHRFQLKSSEIMEIIT